MSTLVYSMLVSLDGYVTAPDGSLDWANVEEELHNYVNRQDEQLAGFLMGRRMWQEMDGFWQTAGNDPSDPPFVREYARIYRSKPRVVVSHTLQDGDMTPGCTLADISAGLETAVRQAMSLAEGRWSVAGPELASECLRLGLVDEVEVYIHPVVLGGGTAFFPPLEQPLQLTLLDCHTFRTGVVHLRYQVGDRAPA